MKKQVKVFPVIEKYLTQKGQASLVAKIEERRNFGIKKYGTELHTLNNRDAKKDAEEEILDCFQYVTQIGLEKKIEVDEVLDKLIEVYTQLQEV